MRGSCIYKTRRGQGRPAYIQSQAIDIRRSEVGSAASPSRALSWDSKLKGCAPETLQLNARMRRCAVDQFFAHVRIVRHSYASIPGSTARLLYNTLAE